MKTRKVEGLEGSGDALKRMSFVDLREIVKPNGVVLWRVNMRSEFGVVRESFVGCCFGLWVWCGEKHR